MTLHRHVLTQLKIIAYTDTNTDAIFYQQAIIKSTTSTESGALCIESEAGNKAELNFISGGLGG